MLRKLLYKWFGLEDSPCPTCEVLTMELSYIRAEKERLLNTILEMNNPKIEMVIPEEVSKESLTPKVVPWRVRQQMLEQEDRAKAQVLRDHAKLEKELGIKTEQESVSKPS